MKRLSRSTPKCSEQGMCAEPSIITNVRRIGSALVNTRTRITFQAWYMLVRHDEAPERILNQRLDKKVIIPFGYVSIICSFVLSTSGQTTPLPIEELASSQTITHRRGRNGTRGGMVTAPSARDVKVNRKLSPCICELTAPSLLPRLPQGLCTITQT